MPATAACDVSDRLNGEGKTGEVRAENVVITPPANPAMRMMAAKAGENFICRSHSVGSKIQSRQLDCSAVSSASESCTREAASRLGEGSTAGNPLMLARNSRADSHSRLQAGQRS